MKSRRNPRASALYMQHHSSLPPAEKTLANDACSAGTVWPSSVTYSLGLPGAFGKYAT